MIEVYIYDGHWYYEAAEGEMICPPFVQKWNDVVSFFGGREVVQVPCPRYKNPSALVPEPGLRPFYRIGQYDKRGNLVAKWPTIRSAAENCGISNVSIRHCLQGKIDFVKGCTFHYL